MAVTDHAVVIGASVAGLLAAAALSERFSRVTVYDRDVLPVGPEPRRGVPHGRQLHALQARGWQALDELLPGFREDMIAAGGLLADVQRDIRWLLDGFLLKQDASGLEAAGLTRETIEWLIRKRVAALPGVRIADNTDVTSLHTELGRVTGVSTQAARTSHAAIEQVDADLVVDAGGRASRTPVWLKELGFPAPATSSVRANVVYVSRTYSRDPAQLGGRLGTVIASYPGRPVGGAVLRIEGERFMVLLSGMIGVEPPVDEDGMLAFADQLAVPDIATVMRESTPLGEPLKYRFPESTWVHYEKLASLPAGLLVCGDAFCSFNPVYAQGMTVAALEALELRRQLTALGKKELGAPGVSADLSRRYVQATSKLVAEAWQTATANDLRFPEVEGKRPAAFGLISAYGERFRAAASVDSALATTFVRIINMIDPPAKLLVPGNVVRVFRAGSAARKTGPE